MHSQNSPHHYWIYWLNCFIEQSIITNDCCLVEFENYFIIGVVVISNLEFRSCHKMTKNEETISKLTHSIMEFIFRHLTTMLLLTI